MIELVVKKLNVPGNDPVNVSPDRVFNLITNIVAKVDLT